MKTVRLKITLMIQLPISVPLKFPVSTPDYRLLQQNFLNSSIIIICRVDIYLLKLTIDTLEQGVKYVQS